MRAILFALLVACGDDITPPDAAKRTSDAEHCADACTPEAPIDCPCNVDGGP